MTQHCVLTAHRAECILCCITRSVASRSKEVVLLCSALMRPHLEYYVHPWGPQWKRDVNLLEQVQRKAIKMIAVLQRLSYEDWLRQLDLFSLEKRRLQADLTAAFLFLKWAYKKAGEGLLTKACSDRTRVNGFKLVEGTFKLHIRKKFFTLSVVTHWKRLPRELVNAPPLRVFKTRLDGALSNLIQWKVSLPMSEALELEDL
ncbi:hypothetical protein WISP_92143 [Willisornis vidua]|uniref:Uncharacterized protein n=1 Tax=Willisornis vidua TaxID=1566151 RepID=A0ABQ9D764_9PASS|nr:hypothetical protein WISP_92143 [Willisornis vidua]